MSDSDSGDTQDREIRRCLSSILDVNSVCKR